MNIILATFLILVLPLCILFQSLNNHFKTLSSLQLLANSKHPQLLDLKICRVQYLQGQKATIDGGGYDKGRIVRKRRTRAGVDRHERVFGQLTETLVGLVGIANPQLDVVELFDRVGVGAQRPF